MLNLTLPRLVSGRRLTMIKDWVAELALGVIARSGSAVTLPCNTPLINSRWFATGAVLSSALGFLLRRSIGCQYVDVSSGPVFVVIACDVAKRIDCEDLPRSLQR